MTNEHGGGDLIVNTPITWEDGLLTAKDFKIIGKYLIDFPFRVLNLSCTYFALRASKYLYTAYTNIFMDL